MTIEPVNCRHGQAFSFDTTTSVTVQRRQLCETESAIWKAAASAIWAEGQIGLRLVF
jgi:hypothetical protein